MSKLLLLPPSVIANSAIVNKLSLGEVLAANIGVSNFALVFVRIPHIILGQSGLFCWPK